MKKTPSILIMFIVLASCKTNNFINNRTKIPQKVEAPAKQAASLEEKTHPDDKRFKFAASCLQTAGLQSDPKLAICTENFFNYDSPNYEKGLGKGCKPYEDKPCKEEGKLGSCIIKNKDCELIGPNKKCIDDVMRQVFYYYKDFYKEDIKAAEDNCVKSGGTFIP